MKRILSLCIVGSLITIFAIPSFAATEIYHEWYSYEKGIIGNSDNMSIETATKLGRSNLFPYLRTTDYIYVDNVPMVKLRDVVNTLNGKIDYNSETKLTKIYLNYRWETGYYSAGCSTRSIAIQPNKNQVYYSTYLNQQESYCTTIIPQIINGSLYIGADDLGHILGGANINSSDYCYFKNGKLYISFGYDVG